jgi:hypothetical protein
MIIWETLTGYSYKVAASDNEIIDLKKIHSRKPLKYFPNAHNGEGCNFACFTGVDYIFSSIGAEELGSQTICFWNYEPKETDKTPICMTFKKYYYIKIIFLYYYFSECQVSQNQEYSQRTFIFKFSSTFFCCHWRKECCIWNLGANQIGECYL